MRKLNIIIIYNTFVTSRLYQYQIYFKNYLSSSLFTLSYKGMVRGGQNISKHIFSIQNANVSKIGILNTCIFDTAHLWGMVIYCNRA